MICCSVKSLPPTTIVSAALAVATTPAPATQAAATRIRFNIFMLVPSKIASSKTSTPHIAALLTQRINARSQQERRTGHQKRSEEHNTAIHSTIKRTYYVVSLQQKKK